MTPWHLDELISGFPVPAGAARVIRRIRPADTQLERMAGQYQAVADAVARAARPLLLSGDCVAALGAVAGLQRRHGDVALVWLDGHGDFNTPEITISGYLAGMSLAILAGRVSAPVVGSLGLRAVSEEKIVLIDARDLDPAEHEALAASPVRRVAAEPESIRAALAGLSASAVYLHVDVDVIDGADLPGLRFSAGPGPAFTRVDECLSAAMSAADVKGACIACTWSPAHIDDEATRLAITRLGRALGAELAWDDHRSPPPLSRAWRRSPSPST